MKTIGIFSIIGFFVFIILIMGMALFMSRYEFSNIKIGQGLFVSGDSEDPGEYYTKVVKIIDDDSRWGMKLMCDDGKTYRIIDYFWGFISKS